MLEPAIKGSIVKGAMDDLTRLRAEGRIQDSVLEARLTSKELDILDWDINPAAWYPIPLYDKLLRLLCEVEGDGKDEYYVRRGRATARRLMEGGLYQQLAFLLRWADDIQRGEEEEETLIQKYRSKLKMVTSMAGSIYNTGRWEIETDSEHPRRVCIAIYDARAYTDPMMRAIDGFLSECAVAARKDLARLHEAVRPSPDLILFRMTRDIIDLYS